MMVDQGKDREPFVLKGCGHLSDYILEEVRAFDLCRLDLSCLCGKDVTAVRCDDRKHAGCCCAVNI